MFVCGSNDTGQLGSRNLSDFKKIKNNSTETESESNEDDEESDSDRESFEFLQFCYRTIKIPIEKDFLEFI